MSYIYIKIDYLIYLTIFVCVLTHYSADTSDPVEDNYRTGDDPWISGLRRSAVRSDVPSKQNHSIRLHELHTESGDFNR